MTQNPDIIRETVREHYAERIKSDTLSQSKGSVSCCGPDNGSAAESRLYPADLLATLPDGESAISYGCGDPITLASLQPGQTVLDLGSGAGLDCFFAAKKVGAAGHVIGVDMTPEMIDRARSSAKRLNLDNVEFRQGYLEDLPVQANSVDVIISNCVINLSPDKSKVFSEAFRVLKPGGKLAVSDIVTDGPLPEPIKKSLSAWAGCIAGALDVKDYKAAMTSAGLIDIALTPTYFDKQTIDDVVQDLGDSFDMKTYSSDQIHKTVFSARITAHKPD